MRSGPEGGNYHITRTIGVLQTLLSPPTPAWDQEGFNDVDFVLKPETQDALDPVHLALAVRKVGAGGVTLAIEASVDKQKAIVWSQLVAFDANGDMVVRVWTHRLKFHRAGDGVTVAFTPDGDGTALPANDLAQCQPGWITGCM